MQNFHKQIWVYKLKIFEDLSKHFCMYLYNKVKKKVVFESNISDIDLGMKIVSEIVR